jgi:GT2 family glycosyltransferase
MEIPDTAVIIATMNRPQILADTLRSVSRQTHRALRAYVSVNSLEDVPPVEPPEAVTVLVGPTGGSAQRNNTIRCVPPEVKYTAFLDDDIELHPTYLEHAVGFLEKKP